MGKEQGCDRGVVLDEVALRVPVGKEGLVDVREPGRRSDSQREKAIPGGLHEEGIREIDRPRCQRASFGLGRWRHMIDRGAGLVEDRRVTRCLPCLGDDRHTEAGSGRRLDEGCDPQAPLAVRHVHDLALGPEFVVRELGMEGVDRPAGELRPEEVDDRRERLCCGQRPS